jgi:hypothetical protein
MSPPNHQENPATHPLLLAHRKETLPAIALHVLVLFLAKISIGDFILLNIDPDASELMCPTLAN